jgi:CheY-like chemotaxis protein
VRLAQVISNLLNNAAKYTPEGGRVTLAAERRGDEVEIRVSDNGIGIPPENLDSIFDMFTQVESHAFHSQGGLGIGLALVKGLVALHHGTIEARSEGPGRGSEFCVRLPAGTSVPSAVSAPLRARDGHAPLKILVVDDNRDAASSLSTLASMMGHEVRVAFEGEKALEIASEFRPHTVLLDLGMPGMDGYEVCRRLREEPWGKPMKIVAVTGWGQDEDRRKSAECGFDLHLVKPVGPETLVELLGDLR